MSKKDSKQNSFSSALCRAIGKVVRDKCSDGTCITREEVAETLHKKFTQDSVAILTIMVGEAVRLGEVSGVSSRRGSGGGLYHVSSYEKAQAAE